MDNARRVELVNLMLPTRLFVAELDAAEVADREPRGQKIAQ